MELHWDIYNPESDAPTILVLGASLAGSSAVQWGQVAEHLRSAAVVAFVDLPGHALTPVWDDADEPTLDVVAAAMMEAIRAIRDQVGNKPVVFAGLSISGATALHMARDYPDELAGVAVVASSAKVGDSAGWLKRAERVKDGGTAQLMEETEQRWFLPSFRARQRGIVEVIMESVAAVDDHSYAQLCRALAVHDVRADLPDLRLPVLLIAGQRDVGTPMEAVEQMAETIPGAELKVIADVAHQVTVAAPGDVATLLLNFLERAALPRRTAQNDD